MIFVTGPAAAGRNELWSKLLRSEQIINSKKNFKFCKLLTTDESYASENSDWF